TRAFIVTIKNTTNANELDSLFKGFAALADRFSDDQAKAAAEPFLAAMESTTTPYVVCALGAGLAGLRAGVTESKAKQAVERLLATIKGRAGTDGLEYGEYWCLVIRLEDLAAKLTDGPAEQATEPFVAAVKSTTNPYALWAVGRGLGALPPALRLTDRQAEE